VSRARRQRALGGARLGARVLAERAGGPPALLLANLYPTHHCNLRCTYCASPYRRTPELDTASWLRIVDELAALGCRRVLWLGGEPLLRSDLGALVARVRERGMACLLTSNGVLVPERIDALRGLDTLVLSLDAPGPANDAVRGEGVFEAVVRAIGAARAAGIPVKLKEVLSRDTAAELDALLAFAERHDLGLTVSVMRSGAPDLWHRAESIKAPDAAIAELLARLAELARGNPRLLFSPATYEYGASWGEYARERIEAREAVPDDPRLRDGPTCRAGASYLSIGPDGSSFPCVSTFGRIRGANAAREGVAAAWRSLQGHPCIACWTPCLVEQNALFSLRPRTLLHFARRHLLRFA
jgi:MoaA/NifB/PqqE/SkfB family radical SAM enzyme